MIEIKDITLGFDGRTLISGASATFPDGTLTALIGRNGSGKSTLLRCIAGFGKPASGSVHVDGKNLQTLTTGQRARSLAFVGTTRIRVPNLTCREAVAMARAPYTNWIGRLSDADNRAVDQALELVGMTDMASRTLNTLSDGERQRVMTARAVAQETRNILLDEPTSFLDLPSRNAHVSLLRDIAANQGKTIIFSTHELNLAQTMAHNIALVDDLNHSLIILPSSSPLLPSEITRIFGNLL